MWSGYYSFPFLPEKNMGEYFNMIPRSPEIYMAEYFTMIPYAPVFLGDIKIINLGLYMMMNIWYNSGTKKEGNRYEKRKSN